MSKGGHVDNKRDLAESLKRNVYKRAHYSGPLLWNYSGNYSGTSYLTLLWNILPYWAQYPEHSLWNTLLYFYGRVGPLLSISHNAESSKNGVFNVELAKRGSEKRFVGHFCLR